MSNNRTQKARNTEVPGNTMASQKAFDEYVYGLGEAWLEFLRALDRARDDELRMKRLTLKGVWGPHGVLLAVLTADMAGEPVVAFHNADEVSMLWRGLGNRLKNGTLKWKVDEYED